MRRFAACLAMFVLSSLVLSCAGIPRYVAPGGQATPRYYVHVWLQNGLSEADADAGCEIWNDKGVSCVIVRDPELADVRVYADPRPCTPNADGHRTLAEAWQSGKIVFYTSCFMDGSTFDRHQFRAVMGHEIGHEIGVWDHVPLECTASCRRHPNGTQVCGRALMNPLYDKDVYFMTPADGLAFDVRDPMHSVLVEVADRPAPPDEPGCVYRTR